MRVQSLQMIKVKHRSGCGPFDGPPTAARTARAAANKPQPMHPGGVLAAALAIRVGLHGRPTVERRNP